MQAAEQLVEIVEAGGESGQLGVALVGRLGGVDGGRDRGREGNEAALRFAGLGETEELLFRLLDLLGGGVVEARLVGGVDHVLADADQLPAQRQIVDVAAVVLGVDDGGGGAGEVAEVARAIGIDERRVAVERRLQGQRRRDLAAFDEGEDRLVDAPVNRLAEMLGLQERGNAIRRLVVDQHGAKQGLLGLDIVRQLAIGRPDAARSGRERGDIADLGHVAREAITAPPGGGIRHRPTRRKTSGQMLSPPCESPDQPWLSATPAARAPPLAAGVRPCTGRVDRCVAHAPAPPCPWRIRRLPAVRPLQHYI